MEIMAELPTVAIGEWKRLVEEETQRQLPLTDEQLQEEFAVGARDSSRAIVRMAVAVSVYEGRGRACVGLPRTLVQMLKGVAESRVEPSLIMLWTSRPLLASRASYLHSLSDQRQIAKDAAQKLFHVPSSPDEEFFEEAIIPSLAKPHEIDQLIDMDAGSIRDRAQQIIYEKRLLSPRTAAKTPPKFSISRKRKVFIIPVSCEITFEEWEAALRAAKAGGCK